MINHKYLDELNLSNDDKWFLDDTCWAHDERIQEWKKEKEEYGFNSRETWELETAFYLWLYERLRMYLDCAVVDLNYHTYKYRRGQYSQLEMIQQILNRIRFRFSKDFDCYNKEDLKYVSEIGKIWSLIMREMWW